MRLPRFLATLAALFTACSESPPENALVVGMELVYPPFEMRNTNNEPDGISVRMAEALAEHLGRPLVIEDIGWDGLRPALMSDKIDLIISSMTKTEERAKSIDFSDGYVTNGICLLVGKDSSFAHIDDFRDGSPTIAVKLATTGHLWAAENLPNAKLTLLDEAANCALEVSQGKADGFIYDQISIYQLWKRYEDTTRPILDPIRSETWGIGVRKGNDDLRNQVNQFLKKFRESNKFNELASIYMKEEKAAFEEMNVPFIFN